MQYLQVGRDGKLRHLLTLEGLSREMIHRILDNAASFLNVSDRDVKKVPLLRGRSVFNLFFENSTRTRTTFEIAATRLSADIVNLNITTSSASKGESLLDTIDNLAAMAADIFVVRHGQSGAPHLIASHVQDGLHVINAGDGRHAHPTQGLLDMYTIRHFKGDFTQLRVAIVGDVLHSRVARSDIHALTTLGVPEVRVIGPLTLLPFGEAEPGTTGLELLLPLTLKWAQEEKVELARALALLTKAPARIAGIEEGEVSGLAPGAVADLCVFDPQAPWVVDDDSLLSQGKDTPYHGRELVGRALMTVVGGRIVYERASGDTRRRPGRPA